MGRLNPSNRPYTPSGGVLIHFLKRARLHLLLFVLTCISTTLVQGVAYSICLMAILLLHELGHYITARYYGVAASLPYFIPFPLNIFGTCGAVIKMQGVIPNRKALFDIGIMGPVAGVVVALPVTIVGIALSEVLPAAELETGYLRLGDSLLFATLTHIIHGSLPEGSDLLLHPIGFAGWAGMFVTALNLIPIGQLDGGHIVYALFYKSSAKIYRLVFLAFVILTAFFSPAFLVFLLLIYFLVKLKHPPTMDDSQPIDRRRFVFGILGVIFFLITFPPVPIQLGPA